MNIVTADSHYYYCYLVLYAGPRRIVALPESNCRFTSLAALSSAALTLPLTWFTSLLSRGFSAPPLCLCLLVFLLCRVADGRLVWEDESSSLVESPMAPRR